MSVVLDMASHLVLLLDMLEMWSIIVMLESGWFTKSSLPVNNQEEYHKKTSCSCLSYDLIT